MYMTSISMMVSFKSCRICFQHRFLQARGTFPSGFNKSDPPPPQKKKGGCNHMLRGGVFKFADCGQEGHGADFRQQERAAR